MQETKVVSGTRLRELDLIRSVLNTYLEEGKAVSLWRLPDQQERNVIICSNVINIDPDHFSVEDSQPGFVVSRFDRQAQKLFLPAEIHLKINNGEIKQHKGAPIPDTFKPTSKLKLHFIPIPEAHAELTSEHYQQLVADGVDAIDNGLFQKVVPARRQSFPVPEEIDILDVFDRLCEQHPQALITLVSTPQTGTWMGASPELLVNVNSKFIFKTTALASTQVYQPGTDLKTVLWNQKEIEEQAMVTRYIVNSCFKKVRIREYEEIGPKTFRAGNLLHLKTDFIIDMVATNFMQLGTVALRLLHPTSAVCGMAMEPALKFLKDREGYDRELYTGYWGPVNVDQETHIYVNLRCMRAGQTEAILYAGAGVTIDSVPALEWEETVNKMNTLRQVILS
ncbi:MAG: chorismate-binding protein [Bacteroidota bacterium]